MAVRVLARLGADLNGVRDQVLQLTHGQPGRDMADEPPRPGPLARSRLTGEALVRIDSLDAPLAAIERWVGVRPDRDDLDDQIAQLRRQREAALDRQDFETAPALRDKEKQLLARRDNREKEWMRAAAGRPSLAGELAQVNAELERLRALLRENGIEPGDDAA